MKYKLNNNFIINTFFKYILKILLFKDLNKVEINNIFKYIYVVLNIKYYFNDKVRQYERSLKDLINKWKDYIIK